jgi:hypothetical protein
MIYNREDCVTAFQKKHPKESYFYNILNIEARILIAEMDSINKLSYDKELGARIRTPEQYEKLNQNEIKAFFIFELMEAYLFQRSSTLKKEMQLIKSDQEKNKKEIMDLMINSKTVYLFYPLNEDSLFDCLNETYKKLLKIGESKFDEDIKVEHKKIKSNLISLSKKDEFSYYLSEEQTLLTIKMYIYGAYNQRFYLKKDNSYLKSSLLESIRYIFSIREKSLVKEL